MMSLDFYIRYSKEIDRRHVSRISEAIQSYDEIE